MKKSLLIGLSTITMMLSVTANAQTSFFQKKNVDSKGYNTIGVERMDLTTDLNEEFSGATMFKLGTGYNFNRNIAVEFNALLPINNKTTRTYNYSYYDSITPLEDGSVEYSELVEASLSNNVKPSFVTDLSLVLKIPLHKNFNTYFNVGYAYSRITYAYNGIRVLGTQGDVIEPIDFLPVSQISTVEDFNLYSRCELFGSFEQCGYEAVEVSDKYSSGGISYGVGVSFNYSNNTSITLKYKKYSYSNDFELSSISLDYKWNW